MDFSKIKKIFYIVAIISMLLSIKSRVLGATIEDFPTIPEVYEGQNFIIFKNSANTYYYLCVLNGNINDSNHVFYNTNTKLLTFPSGSGKTYRTPVNNGSSWSFFENMQSSNGIDRYGFYVGELLISSVDIYDPTDNEIVFPSNFSTVIAPSFDNASEIENGNPDGVFISPADYSENDYLYFHLLEIDNTVPNSDTTIYYYSDKTFALNKDSDYFRTWVDPSIDGYYYYIPRYKLGLTQNTSYLYVLNNSKEQIQNSFGIYEKDVANGIYDVVESDTAGVISASEEESDRMKNIEESLTDPNVSQDTETDIEGSLDFNNQNTGLNNLNNGFFSRLTTMLSNLLGYNLSEDTSVSIPLPNSNKNIILHSLDIYNNVTGTLRLIINAFWVYIFTFYMWKFINKIYIAVSTGHILDTFSSSGEAITNDML